MGWGREVGITSVGGILTVNRIDYNNGGMTTQNFAYSHKGWCVSY